ncbi:MAG TPA: DUF4389 domain-containing protein [Acidimicrobiales bacterium]|jgi:hypothetical protein|nr:DUF4389 domain-containing protein [Acidimicrobiales bacterium]
MADIVPAGRPPTYPVAVDVEQQLTDRNRVTTLFRLILAVPQLLIVGGGVFAFQRYGSGGSFGGGGLSSAAFVMAVVAWFAIIFASRHPRGLWDFIAYYMRWRVRVAAYMALFRDDYPPFGDEPYPISYDVAFPEDAERDRLSVGLRFLYIIPHVIVLLFLLIAWGVTSVIAWFAILFTGSYPKGLYEFGVGVMRWEIRVESYALLMRDEYPPFSFDP